MSQIIERPTDLRDIVGSWEATGPVWSDAKIRFQFYTGNANGVAGGVDYIKKAMKRNFNHALQSYGWAASEIQWDGGFGTSAQPKTKRGTLDNPDRTMRRGERLDIEDQTNIQVE